VKRIRISAAKRPRSKTLPILEPSRELSPRETLAVEIIKSHLPTERMGYSSLADFTAACALRDLLILFGQRVPRKLDKVIGDVS